MANVGGEAPYYLTAAMADGRVTIIGTFQSRDVAATCAVMLWGAVVYDNPAILERLEGSPYRVYTEDELVDLSHIFEGE